MKGLERNKKTFWYANPTGTEPIYDEYGNEAGAKTLYEKPKKYKANISRNLGASFDSTFGRNEDSIRQITPLPAGFDIKIGAIVWVDVKPDIHLDGYTCTPHDYIVTRVSESINFINATIRSVNVGGGWDAAGSQDLLVR